MELYNDLLPDPLPTEPMALAAAWLATALAARQQPNPDSMVLATATADGQPSARVVLCKELDVELGRVSFVTNYDSRKGRELERERARGAGVPLGSRASPDPRRRRGGQGAGRARATRTSIRATGSAASAPGPARRASRCARASSSNAAVRAAADRFGAPHPTAGNIDEPPGRAHPAAAVLGRLLRLGRRRGAVDRGRRAHPRARALDPLANYRRRGIPRRPVVGHAPAALSAGIDRRVAQAAHRDPAADPGHRGVFELVRPAQHHRLGRDAVDRRVPGQCRRRR